MIFNVPGTAETNSNFQVVISSSPFEDLFFQKIDSPASNPVGGEVNVPVIGFKLIDSSISSTVFMIF